VQQCVEGAAALAVIAIDRERRRQAVVGTINCLDGAGGAYVGSAGDRSHALHFAASDVDVGRRERAAAQIGRAGRLCVGVAGAAHRYAGCGRKIYRPGVARLAVYGHRGRVGGKLLVLPASVVVPVLVSAAAVTAAGALSAVLPILRVAVLLSVPPMVVVLAPWPDPVSMLKMPLLVRLTPTAVVTATFSCTSNHRNYSLYRL